MQPGSWITLALLASCAPWWFDAWFAKKKLAVTSFLGRCVLRLVWGTPESLLEDVWQAISLAAAWLLRFACICCGRFFDAPRLIAWWQAKSEEDVEEDCFELFDGTMLAHRFYVIQGHGPRHAEWDEVYTLSTVGSQDRWMCYTSVTDATAFELVDVVFQIGKCASWEGSIVHARLVHTVTLRSRRAA